MAGGGLGGGGDISVDNVVAQLMQGFELDPSLQREQRQLLRGPLDFFARQQIGTNRAVQQFAGTLGAQDFRGATPIFAPNGEVIGFDVAPLSAAEQSARQLEETAFQRSLAALQGQEDVDPTLTRLLGEEQLALQERLRRQFGPGGAETSSPAIEALADQSQRRIETLFRSNLQLAGTLGGLGQSLQQQRENITNQAIQELLGTTQATSILPAVSSLQNTTNLFNAPLNRMFGQGQFNAGQQNQVALANQNAQLQAGITNAQIGQQASSSLFGGLGQLAGLGIGAFSGGFGGLGGLGSLAGLGLGGGAQNVSTGVGPFLSLAGAPRFGNF